MSKVLRYNLEGKDVSTLLKGMSVYGVPYWQCAVTEDMLSHLKLNLQSSEFTCERDRGIYYNPKIGYSIHFYVTDKMKNQKQLLLQPFKGLCINNKVEISITVPNPPKDTVIVCDTFQPTERPKQFLNVFWEGVDQELRGVKGKSGCGDIPYNPLPSFKHIIGRLYWKKWEG